MSEFVITTTDSEYTYTSTIPVGIAFSLENNNKTSSTQGFLVKVQKGRNRVKAIVRLKVSKANYRTIFEPMLYMPAMLMLLLTGTYRERHLHKWSVFFPI